MFFKYSLCSLCLFIIKCSLSSITWVFEHSLALVVSKIKIKDYFLATCGESDEHCLPTLINHFIVPYLRTKMEEIGKIALGTWSVVTSSFVFVKCVSF